MAKPQTFRGFGEFGKDFHAEALKRRFETVFGEGFEGFPPGNFKSTIAGIDSLSILKTLPDQKTGKVKALNIVLFYQLGKKEAHTTLTLGSGGNLIGEIPPRLGVQNKDVLDDVLHTAETVNSKFFESVDDEILPRPRRGEGKDGEGGGEAGPGRPVVIDPKRLAFMIKQKQVLFGVTGARRGFGGYYGFVFPDRVVLENPRVNNAVYVFPLRSPISVPLGRFRLPPEQRMRKEERQGFIDGEWRDIAGLTRPQAQRMRGVERVIHPQVNDAEWEQRMQEMIDRKLEFK